MLSIGIDIGSVAAKAAAYNGGEKIVATAIYPTGWSPPKEVGGEKLLKDVLKQANATEKILKP